MTVIAYDEAIAVFQQLHAINVLHSGGVRLTFRVHCRETVWCHDAALIAVVIVSK